MSFFTRIVDSVCNSVAHQHSGGSLQIINICHELGWEPQWAGDKIVVNFTVHSQEYELSIHHAQDGSSPLLLCVSQLFMPVTRVPSDIYGFLLNRNSQAVPMAWQVVETEREGMASFAVRYLAFAKGLDAQVFGYNSKEMLSEVITFDDMMRAKGFLR